MTRPSPPQRDPDSGDFHVFIRFVYIDSNLLLEVLYTFERTLKI